MHDLVKEPSQACPASCTVLGRMFAGNGLHYGHINFCFPHHRLLGCLQSLKPQDTLQSALRSTGVDFGTLKSTTGSLAKTAEEGAAVATPFVTKVANFLSTAEPTTLAELGVGAVALYYLGPGLLGAAFGSFRGFAGEISAAQALDTLSDGNTVLIDIRTEVRGKELVLQGGVEVPINSGQIAQAQGRLWRWGLAV